MNDTSDQTVDLGDPSAEFGASPGRIVVGYACAATLALIGACLIVAGLIELLPWGVPSAVVIAFIFFGLAAYLWRFIHRIHSQKILVYAAAFAVVRPGRTLVFRWDRIVEARECFFAATAWQRGVSAPAAPTGKGVSYEVVRDDGEVFAFDRDILSPMAVFRDLLLKEASARPIRWVRVDAPNLNLD